MVQEPSRTVPAPDRGRRYRWSELQELIFLDRYAQKGSRADITVGDTVVVMTKEHPKYPQKEVGVVEAVNGDDITVRLRSGEVITQKRARIDRPLETRPDRKSTRLNSSHVKISYAVFCLKKKTQD